MDDEGTWPQARTREMFNAWFESEVTSGVCDLTPEEPLTHDDVEADDLAYAISHCGWCDVELEEVRLDTPRSSCPTARALRPARALSCRLQLTATNM
jgi:hypothetical protein